MNRETSVAVDFISGISRMGFKPEGILLSEVKLLPWLPYRFAEFIIND